MGSLKKQKANSNKKIKKIILFLGAALMFGAVFLNFKTQALVLKEKNEIKGKTVTDEVFVLKSIDGLKVKREFKENLSLPIDGNGYKKEYIYTSFVKKADFVFNAIAFHYNGYQPSGTQIILKARTSFDGENFSDWIEVEKDNDLLGGPHKTNEVFSQLLFEGGQYYQYQIILKTNDVSKTPIIKNFKVTTINSLNGPNPLKKNKAQASEPAPKIITRSEWGADPKYMTWTPQYADVKVFILHHTAGSNNPSDPAAVMRGIYYYHAITLGWGDIGYNFVLDQYGNIYEGRYGGSKVVGGHAKGYNNGSCGIAVMGTYTSTYLNSAQIESLSRLIGYKSAEYNIDPLGKTYFVDKTINNISGHRDVNSTACPGDAFYNQLPKIREEALKKYLDYQVQLTSFIIPSETIIESEVTAQIVFKNPTSWDVTLEELGVAVRYGVNRIRDFAPQTNITIPANSSKSFTFAKTFGQVGNYQAWVYIKKAGILNRISEVKLFQCYFPQEKIIFSNINPIENSFIVGENIVINFTLKNSLDNAFTPEAVGVAVRYGVDRIRDYPEQTTNLTFSPGEVKSFTFTKSFTQTGKYTYWTYITINGIKYIMSQPNYFYLYPPTTKVFSEQINHSPITPSSNYSTSVVIVLKNQANSDLVFEEIGVAVRYGNNRVRDFEPQKNVTIPANSSKTFTFTKTFTQIGNYWYWAYYKFYGIQYKISPVKYFYISNISLSTDINVFLNQASSSQLTLGEPFLVSFSIKNQSKFDVILEEVGVPVRYGNNRVRDFEPQKNVTIPANSSKTFTFTKTFTQIGNYWYWAYYRYGQNQYSLFDVKYFTIINPPKMVNITSDGGDFDIWEGNMKILTSVQANFQASVYYVDGWYYVKTSNYFARTRYPIRFVPKSSAILRVTSYTDYNWDKTWNDNQFRGVIEVRYSSVSGKLWVINELPLEDYLKGIAETSASAPLEHLKTMTVAARSYAYWHIIRGGKHKGEPFHLKNSRNGNGDDQQYKGYGLEKRFPQLTQAVDLTKGEVIGYNGSVALATYFSRSDGRTRSAQEAWGWTWAPWLVSVPDPDCAGMSLSGHGVGLSGYGALKKAERGESYKSILSYYYKNTSIIKIDNPLIRVAIYGISF